MRTSSFAFASASLIAIAASFMCVPAFAAQGAGAAAAAPPEDNTLTEIVVTARRENESLQNVPVSVQVVTGDQVQKLAITQPSEISKLTPGLTLSLSDPVTPVIILRGVRWTQASGTPAIPIYLNEMSFDPVQVLQTMYDVGQVEVLRGPQGTSRGAPSISGAVTITSRRPNLDDFGGYASGQYGEHGHSNLQAGMNVPLIPGKLAIRLAGDIDQSEGNHVKSLDNSQDPSVKTTSGRISVRFVPIDTVEVNAMFQRTDQTYRLFNQVAGPGSAGVPAIGVAANYNSPAISARDYLAVENLPSRASSRGDLFTLNASWEFLGQRLSYNFGSQRTSNHAQNTQDPTNQFIGFDPIQITGTVKPVNMFINEVRLSSLPGNYKYFDYAVGVYSQRSKGDILNNGPAAYLAGTFGNPFSGFPNPVVNPAAVDRYSLRAISDIALETKNYSAYGNLTLHLPYDTELSGGLRWIHDQRPANVAVTTSSAFVAAFRNPLAGRLPCSALVPGVQDSPFYPGVCDFPVAAGALPTQSFAKTFTPVIYNVSLSHKFTPELLGYATVGSSWRAGLPAIANLGLPDNLLFPAPEKATSYEIGMKSTWGRVRINADLFQINYQNQLTQFLGIPYYDAVGQSIKQTNLAFYRNINARVRGVEAEIDYQPIRDLMLSANLSYAKIESQGGDVPCNDPTRPVTATNVMNFCPSVKGQELNASPPFQASVNGSYVHPIGPFDGYFRFVVDYQGHNPNFGTSDAPTQAYTLVDLYAGATGNHDGWDVGVYAKNIFDKKIALTSQAYVAGSNALAVFGSSGLSAVTATTPREVGVQARYAFGSR